MISKFATCFDSFLTAYFSLRINVSGTENSDPSGPPVFVGRARIADLTKQFESLRQPRVCYIFVVSTEFCFPEPLTWNSPGMRCAIVTYTHAHSRMHQYAWRIGTHRLELTFINTESRYTEAFIQSELDYTSCASYRGEKGIAKSDVHGFLRRKKRARQLTKI